MSELRVPALHVDGLRVELTDGTDVVDDISFSVEPGEVLAIVGESGCGKTTLAMALLGHARSGTRIAGGSVLLAGEEVLGQDARRLRALRGASISYVAQDPGSSLNPRQRIGAQIIEMLLVHGRSRDESLERARALVERVGMPATEEFLRRYPFELSGGQQQRIALAIALAMRPAAVVLDEPTTGLDVTTQRRVLELLAELGTESHAGFVYVTHDLAVVDTIADQVMVMYAGRAVEVGRRADVFREPEHPYTAMLLDSVPRLSMRRAITGIAGTTPAPRDRPSGCFFAPRCPLADDLCHRETPPVAHPGPDHAVRCWHSASVGTLARAGAAAESEEVAERAAVLRVSGLGAGYGRGRARHEVLHNVSFDVAPGECVALVGESGSGKSTLGRCIAGLHAPDTGTIGLDGAPLAPLARMRGPDELRRLQIVFQNPNRSLNPTENVDQALQRPLRHLRHLDRRSCRMEIVGLLERVRLPSSVLDRYPRELSGGEKQRVAIARALAAEPSIVVCDEITSALDVSIQAAIVTLLDELRRDGLALLFITHNLALVNSIADRVLVLEAGRVCESGRTAEVIASPAHVYTRELLAAAPELTGVER